MKMDERIKKIEEIKTEEVLETLVGGEFKEGLVSLEGILEDFQISQEKLPDVGILCNNKIFELNHKFHEKGLSMFGRINERTGEVEDSVIGDAIISVLFSYASASFGPTEDGECLEEISIGEQEENEKKSGKFISFVKGVFERGKERRRLIETKERLVKEIASRVQAYREICDSMFKYNLEQDLVDTLALYFELYYESDSEKEHDLYESVIPDMVKLGYIGKVTQLKERVKIEKYPEWNVDYILETQDVIEYKVVNKDVKEIDLEVFGMDI